MRPAVTEPEHSSDFALADVASSLPLSTRLSLDTLAVTVLLFIACVECRVAEGPRCHKTAGKHTEDECSCLQSTWSSVCSSGNIVCVN